MSYRDQSDLYVSTSERNRFKMCIIEQGNIFSTNADPATANLGKLVTTGDLAAIDSVIAAICTGPNWSTLDDDLALLSAVQSVWPAVAAAWYVPAA
jgi:hypothetical protein